MIINFRIDDVSVNTDAARLSRTIQVIRDRIPRSHFILAISPLVHTLLKEPEADHERVFPRILSAHSDHRHFFKVNRGGVPSFVWELKKQFSEVSVASHGLVHVDHRLLGREAQELSIVTSCSLIDTKVFVPPFNKYNADTIQICREHGIGLIMFEKGWKHVRFNKFETREIDSYYFHTHDTSPEFFATWLG